MNVSIIGLGYFGFALLKHLDSNSNNDYKLFARDRKKNLISNLKNHHHHTLFHTDIVISEDVSFSSALSDIIPSSDIIILAVPSIAIEKVMDEIEPYLSKNVIFVNTAKALCKETGRLLSQQIVKKIPSHITASVAHLAGGTIASDLLKEEPLGIDIASTNIDTCNTLATLFSSPRLHVSTTTDINGVELASAYKNIVAVLAGIVSGLGFSYGSETHIISRASKEIIDLVISQGFIISDYPFSSYSQCWGNDMLMSCTGDTRNRKFGMEIGRLGSSNKAIKSMNAQLLTIESIPTISSLKKSISSKEEEYPVLQALFNIVIFNADPKIEILGLFDQ